MSRPYQALLALAVAVARDAGAVLREELHRPGGPRGGGDHADVDAEVEELIRGRLTAATPFSYLGEELGARPGADPSHVWVVDPNDGTAPFLKGARGAAVAIALLSDGEPVLGVVHAYAYPDSDGDLLAWAEGEGPVTRNDVAVTARLPDTALDAEAVVIISQAADGRPVENALCVAPARYLAMPSLAYRLARVAAGDAVAAVSLAGAKSWDYAAGHALLRGAGGELVDQDGHPIRYDAHGQGRTWFCFGGSLETARTLAARPWTSVMSGAKSVPPLRAPSVYPLARPRPDRLVRDAAMLRRAQGCLLGQLAGDALGSRVELRSAASIAGQYPDGVRDLADGGTWDTIAGQPTDDSEMALLLARSIVQRGAYDPAAALDAYVHWYRSPPFDMGGTTRAALQAAAGAPAGERLARVAAAALPDSQANGSLMRASPLGILGALQPGAAEGWALADSALTHPHPVCRAACAAFVAALAAAIGGGEDARGTWTAARAAAARAGDSTVVAALDAAEDGPPASFTVHEGWVLIALRNAFFQLLHAPSLEEGLIATVGSGGDTDTNAAIAGALLGAVHGREAIPLRWRRAVLTCRPLAEIGARQPRAKEFWPVDALILAESLLSLGSLGAA